jgi:hypothetical protein
MSTMIGYTVEQETDTSGKVLHSLLMLARNFLNQTETKIQSKHPWDSQRYLQNVPPRVWKRHSALLTMLVDQAATAEPPHHNDAD